MMFIKI